MAARWTPEPRTRPAPPEPRPAPEPAVPGPRHRGDRSDAERLRRSAGVRSVAAVRGAEGAGDDIAAWLAERSAAGGFRVERIPFAGLDGWAFDPRTGDLAHSTGRFFTVRGLGAGLDDGGAPAWEQPIIDQPEVGILGLLAKEFDGVVHLLMQAKMEPGNPEPVQLSPTVQATRSNYTGAHGGRAVRHLEYFREPGRARVLADVLQSEHGSWFLGKANRNMIVEVPAEEDVPEHPDFRWVSLGELGRLLRMDGVVNMDARSVLACAPAYPAEPRALHSDTELLSWFTGERARRRVRADPLPLASIGGWVRDDERIRHEQGRHFEVVAVSVRAGTREVRGWTQPLFRPVATGVCAFLTRRIGGVAHLLVHARPEGGLLEGVELAPTVQRIPANYADVPAEERPPFLDEVLAADPERVLYRAVHTEEGGRFHHARNAYLVVRDEGPLRQPPPGYIWATPGQLGELARHARYLNVQARTLLSCTTTGAVHL